MFTGLIQAIGTVSAATDRAKGRRIRIESALDLSRVATGASIACSGCCLTAVDMGPGWFEADISPETLRLTRAGQWQVGARVNLEPSLRMGDELGGHFVFGHVDGLATLAAIEKSGDYHVLRLRAPAGLERFVAPKGSVALDGISLTVNAVEGDHFEIMIVPHTWAHTTIGDKKPGDSLHFEADMLARYVARMLQGAA